MTPATGTAPTLREIVLDALSDAYYSRRASVEECPSCTKQPAGVGPCHQEDGNLAREYDEARKQIEQQPDGPEVLAVLGTYSNSSGGDS